MFFFFLFIYILVLVLNPASHCVFYLLSKEATFYLVHFHIFIVGYFFYITNAPKHGIIEKMEMPSSSTFHCNHKQPTAEFPHIVKIYISVHFGWLRNLIGYVRLSGLRDLYYNSQICFAAPDRFLWWGTWVGRGPNFWCQPLPSDIHRYTLRRVRYMSGLSYEPRSISNHLNAVWNERHTRW